VHECERRTDHTTVTFVAIAGIADATRSLSLLKAILFAGSRSIMHTEKQKKTHMTMTLKFNRVPKVIEVAYMSMQNFIKLSAAVRET